MSLRRQSTLVRVRVAMAPACRRASGRPPTEPDVAQPPSEEASWYRHTVTWYLDSQRRAGYTLAEGRARYLPAAAHDSILEVSCLTLKASEMKFLVVDDHALIRDAMRGVLKELEGGAIVLEAASARQAMDLIPQHPDLALILLDLQLPDRDGIEAMGELRELYPAISVVMLSAFNDRDNVVRALDNGALGFIPKTDSREILLGALRLILAGGIYIPPEILTLGPAMTAASDNATAAKTTIAGRTGSYSEAGRRAGADDGGQKQQAHLPRARPGRADREEPCVCDPQGAWGHEPHRGGTRSRRFGLGAAPSGSLIIPSVIPAGSRQLSRRVMMARNIMGLTGLCSR